ncbi:MAG TPA: hypothetical protein VGM18_17720 [Candidatus Sulfotelmatobacter sp.]|jgi:hypothetical protein
MRYRTIVALVVALSSLGLAAQADDKITDSPATVLPLGTVEVLGSVSCPQGAATGATCHSINVICPGLPDLTATLAQTLPTVKAKGTIILMNGGGGTTFLNSGFANDYVTDGFRVAQLAWTSDWEDTGGIGLKTAACRGATVFKFIFDKIQGGSHTTAFCGQGSSGGAGALAYSLAHYGMSNYFDYVVIAGGPGVARVDYGCDGSLYTGPPLNLCSQLTSAPYVYTYPGNVNLWENTTTCLTANPPQVDIDRWASDSVISTGGNFSYPKTSMSWFACVTPPVNNTTGQAKFLSSQVVPKNSPPDVNCYSGICKGEAVWQDPGAFSLTHSEMLANCVPNHK